MNRALLEYEIRKNGYTIERFCEMIGLSRSAFYRKCNGQTEFNVSEIKSIAAILHLKSVEPIFFAS